MPAYYPSSAKIAQCAGLFSLSFYGSYMATKHYSIIAQRVVEAQEYKMQQLREAAASSSHH